MPGLEHIYATIQARLNFAAVRLDGLESNSQVSLQRFNIQYEVASPAKSRFPLRKQWNRTPYRLAD